MATSKYFTVTVKPTIAASAQHAAFSNNDLLFDWTAFEMPKGSAKLVNATVLVRPKGDSSPTANDNAIGLVFSSSNTQSLGSANGAVTNIPSNDFLGTVEFSANSYTPVSFNSTVVGTLGRGTGDTEIPMAPLVLTPNVNALSTTTPGYDTLYIGGFCADANTDFTSINAIAEDTDAEHANSQVITMDGASMDVREHFIAGDVVHIGTSVGTPAADSLIGTVASADSATQITLEAVSPTALVDGDTLYNIHPIRIILQFER